MDYQTIFSWTITFIIAVTIGYLGRKVCKDLVRDPTGNQQLAWYIYGSTGYISNRLTELEKKQRDLWAVQLSLKPLPLLPSIHFFSRPEALTSLSNFLPTSYF